MDSEPQLAENLQPDEPLPSSAGSSLIDIIETVIASLADPGSSLVSHSHTGYLWKFGYGQAEIFVQLTGLTEDDLLTVWSNLLALPVPNEAKLLRHLLELNWAQTQEARFALIDQEVVVLTCRSVADLSAGEVSRAITIVGSLARDYGSSLRADAAAV